MRNFATTNALHRKECEGVIFHALPLARPAGLAAHGERLWVSDVASGDICEIDAARGEVVRTFEAAVERPLLLCADAENLWQYDEETMGLHRTGRADGRTFPFGGFGGGINTPFYGVASSGTHLWVLTPDFPYFPIKKSVVHKIELPWKLQEASFDAPSCGCRGLFFDGQYLWTLDDAKGEIYMFDPAKGRVINIIEAPALPLFGLARAAGCLWSIDYKSNRLCRMTLDESVKYSAMRPRRSRISLTETFGNGGPGIIEKWETVLPVPRDYVNQRVLSEAQFSEKPEEWLGASWDEGEATAPKFVLRDIKPGERRRLTMTFEIETRDIRFHIFPDRIGALDQIPVSVKETYLLETAMAKTEGKAKDVVGKIANLFQLQEKDLKKMAEEAVGDEKNPYWIARKLYEHVIDKIEYILPYRNLPTTRIIEQKKGSCTMQARLYAALCQVCGLPSRVLGGHVAATGDSRFGFINHRIAETYLPGFGWLPIDVTFFMQLPRHDPGPSERARSFGCLDSRMFLSEMIGDPASDVLAWEVLNPARVQSTGQAGVEERMILDWAPLS